MNLTINLIRALHTATTLSSTWCLLRAWHWARYSQKFKDVWHGFCRTNICGGKSTWRHPSGFLSCGSDSYGTLQSLSSTNHGTTYGLCFPNLKRFTFWPVATSNRPLSSVLLFYCFCVVQSYWLVGIPWRIAIPNSCVYYDSIIAYHQQSTIASSMPAAPPFLDRLFPQRQGPQPSCKFRIRFSSRQEPVFFFFTTHINMGYWWFLWVFPPTNSGSARFIYREYPVNKHCLTVHVGSVSNTEETDGGFHPHGFFFHMIDSSRFKMAI